MVSGSVMCGARNMTQEVKTEVRRECVLSRIHQFEDWNRLFSGREKEKLLIAMHK